MVIDVLKAARGAFSSIAALNVASQAIITGSWAMILQTAFGFVGVVRKMLGQYGSHGFASTARSLENLYQHVPFRLPLRHCMVTSRAARAARDDRASL